jgi:hypothetical protein
MMLSLKYINAFLGFLTSHCTFYYGYGYGTVTALPFFEEAAGEATGGALAVAGT